MSSSLSSVLKHELLILKERYFFATDDTLKDPVFEGTVRQFNSFTECLKCILERVNRLTQLMESFADGLDGLSQTVLESYKAAIPEDVKIISDCSKMRESTNLISRSDGPHSVLSKFKRDLEYNIVGPLRSHLNNCRHIGHLLELRNRRLAEVAAATEEHKAEECKEQFEAVDQDLFDWFMILEEYKGDILDSLMQTMQYLEYEFFASAAHAIAPSLPSRMEFRPMVEMTPKHLEAQLSLDKRARAEFGDGEIESGLDYSKRLLQSNKDLSPTPQVHVDILSLSSLLAQGFEEGPARKALRECGNDTQTALELLLGASTPNLEEVRIPTTLKRIQRIKELKRKLQDKRVDHPLKTTALPSLEDLLPSEPF